MSRNVFADIDRLIDTHASALWNSTADIQPLRQALGEYISTLLAKHDALKTDRDRLNSEWDAYRAELKQSPYWRMKEENERLRAALMMSGDGAEAINRRRKMLEENERLREGLECAIRAAWDGPAEWVGTGCKESYREWRTRMETTARAALKGTR